MSPGARLRGQVLVRNHTAGPPTATWPPDGTLTSMLIKHLLAGDPRTPPDVLTWLGTQTLTATDALTLATRPDFPTDATLTIETGSSYEVEHLTDALTHPDLPASRRQTFIDAASDTVAFGTVHQYDCFTPIELTHLADVAHTRGETRYFNALALNTHLPTPAAEHVVAYLHAHTSESDRRGPTAADVAALTHHLPTGGADARAAALTANPLKTYAHLTAERGKQHQDDLLWWYRALSTVTHPTLIAEALAIAKDDPALAHWIHRGIATNTRNPPSVRQHAATASDKPDLNDLARTAPADSLRATGPATHPAHDAIAWRNQNVTAAHLRELYDSLDEPLYRIAVALHPASTPDLRRMAMATIPTGTPGAALAFALASDSSPSAALDVPYRDLTRGAEWDPDSTFLDAFDPNTPHRYTWARAAWASHTTRPATTLEYAMTLHGLADHGFSGTLRELLATAAAIVTRA